MKKEKYEEFLRPGGTVWVTHRNCDGLPCGTFEETFRSIKVFDIEGNEVTDPDKWERWMDTHVETDEGVYDRLGIEDLSPFHTLADCDDDDLRKIHREVCHGSGYVDDYRNSLGVDPYEVMRYDDGYTEALGDEWDDHLSEDRWLEYVHDNI